MVTRVRVEAEGSSTQEVEDILQTVFEVLTQESSVRQKQVMFGEEGSTEFRGLVDAQAGEFVIERFARDTPDQPGDGAIVYKGRQTSHYAPPQNLRKLGRRLTSDDGMSGEHFH